MQIYTKRRRVNEKPKINMRYCLCLYLAPTNVVCNAVRAIVYCCARWVLRDTLKKKSSSIRTDIIHDSTNPIIETDHYRAFGRIFVHMRFRMLAFFCPLIGGKKTFCSTWKHSRCCRKSERPAATLLAWHSWVFVPYKGNTNRFQVNPYFQPLKNDKE